MNKVLDASAMIAYLNNEIGGNAVDAMLSRGDPCYAHVMNLCEVYYLFARSTGRPAAIVAIESLEAAGIVFRDDLDTAFWQAVGDLKAGGGISIPDSFCVVLSKRLKAVAVTADRTEFTPVQTAGLCQVFFIRHLTLALFIPSSHKIRALIGLLIFGVLSALRSRVCRFAVKAVRAVPYHSPASEQHALLPAEEILLKAADQPASTSGELLRAARAATVGQAEELVRVVNEGHTLGDGRP